jgi:nucleotide-binding universal stress UspA family protein
MTLTANPADSDRLRSTGVRSILHPTDLTDLSGVALAHALRISLATRGKLHLLHVSAHASGIVAEFPDVRRILAQWGMSEENDPPWLLARRLGIEVDNTHIKRQEPVEGILKFLQQATCDLMVLASRGGGGFDHWLRGSVSEITSRHSALPTLFVTSGARGFVDQITGDVSIRRVLLPIDFSPPPGKAIKAVHRLLKLLTGDVRCVLHLLHVGHSAPTIRVTAGDRSRLSGVILRSGNVPKTIIDAAIEFDADLIAMPTAGRHGILDALRGSTTERVIRHAPCPVFAIPSKW